MTDGTSSVAVAACAMLDPMPSTHPTRSNARTRVGRIDWSLTGIADIVALLNFVTGIFDSFVAYFRDRHMRLQIARRAKPSFVEVIPAIDAFVPTPAAASDVLRKAAA
jgi:hypothetical protein